jgi:hypothetical protein
MCVAILCIDLSVESCTYIEEEMPESDIVTPLLPHGHNMIALCRRRRDVETFKEPTIVVIPDIGASPKCQYLMMAPRS